jgi:hypothetical protein
MRASADAAAMKETAMQRTVTATLEDSATARDFASPLPLVTSFFGRVELIEVG